jgi:hypothetical protein
VFLSIDNGANWTESNNGLTDTNGVTAFAVKDSNIFAGTYSGRGGGVFLSTDNGANWKGVTAGLPNAQVHALAVSGANVFAGTRDSGIFLSTDNGTSWKPVGTGFIGVEIDAFAVSGINIFAAASPGGVFLSTNNGTNWTDVSTGLTDTYLATLFISGNYLFAGAYSGAWRRPLSDFGIADVKNPMQLNDNIFLSPNPTTGIIAVHNAPPNILNVTITNVLGETLSEVTNSGATDFMIDLSKLSTGTYFARFAGQGEIITRKIIKE